MEDERIRRLTTRAVGAVLLAAGAALCVGVVAGVAAGTELPRGVDPRALRLGLLAAGDASSWTSLGVVLLILTPLVRVAGAAVGFANARAGRSLAASVVLLLFLLGSLGHALFRPPPPDPDQGSAAPLDSTTSPQGKQ